MKNQWPYYSAYITLQPSQTFFKRTTQGKNICIIWNSNQSTCWLTIYFFFLKIVSLFKYSWYTILYWLYWFQVYHIVLQHFCTLQCDHPTNSIHCLSLCKLTTILLTTINTLFEFHQEKTSWDVLVTPKFPSPSHVVIPNTWLSCTCQWQTTSSETHPTCHLRPEPTFPDQDQAATLNCPICPNWASH